MTYNEELLMRLALGGDLSPDPQNVSIIETFHITAFSPTISLLAVPSGSIFISVNGIWLQSDGFLVVGSVVTIAGGVLSGDFVKVVY